MKHDHSKPVTTGPLASLRMQFGSLLKKIETRVPFGLRTVLGLLLVIGGVFGFLPILGFWMIPLGLAVIAIDAAVVWRKIKGR